MEPDPTPLPALPARAATAHKYDAGRVLVVAGSAGMLGAGALASRAALRGGAGLVTWAVPRGLLGAAHALLAEAVILALPEDGAGDGTPSAAALEVLAEAAREMDAVALGPGLPASGGTGELLRMLIPEITPPLVLDAGGLDALGRETALLARRRAGTVVTPHEGEMGRLVGQPPQAIRENRVRWATRYAAASRAVTLLKGAGTVVADPDGRHWVCGSGNPGLASAGTGDVLAGLVAALLAQGLGPWEAARLGAHLHGLAGDLAAARLGVHGMLASDVAEALPPAFLRHAAGTPAPAPGGPPPP